MRDVPGEQEQARALVEVWARLERAADRAGRSVADVTVVAVTKGVSWHRVEAVRRNAAARGLPLVDLGENRVRELLDKQRQARTGRHDDVDVRWHFVGSLQRNKVKDVVGRVHLIHSIDSVALAERVSERARGAELAQAVLLQVNTSGEPAKHGFAPDELLDAVREIERLDGVEVRGLMTMAAAGSEARARSSFRSLRDLRDRLVERLPHASELSMGMSEDFEVAVGEGATMIRVGTAIFGPRTP